MDLRNIKEEVLLSRYNDNDLRKNSMAQGFFDLKTAEDFFRMLERNFERFKECPWDVDVAYAFFVSASHLPEWMKDENYKHKMTKKSPLLGICNELAIGAKHFNPRKKKEPPQVKSTSLEMSRYIKEGYIAPGYYEERESLCVYLAPPTLQKLGFGGSSVDAFSLAVRVLEFWREEGRF
jgi:hypothetical protein